MEEEEYTPRMSQRGNSTVIELDIGLVDWRRLSQPSMMIRVNESPVRGSRDELSELGETLEHLTAETSKPITVPVDEDGCPDKPADLNVFRHPYLKTLCRARREALQPLHYRYVVLNFRVMRRNADMYVGFLLNKGVRRSDLYKTKYLPIWTHCIKVRMRVNIKIGVIFHGLKSRLGLTSLLGLHFCIDGFYGVDAFGDAFGNVGPGARPWMELGPNGSAKSLRLTDGDNIYVNVATETTRQIVQRSRPRQSRKISSISGVTFDMPQTRPPGSRDNLRDLAAFTQTKVSAFS